jgi:RNA polymerase sigma-70 factor (ECF subfamily)
MTRALADTYVHSFGRLRSVAARFVRRQDADDLVQEAYLRALAHGSRFRGEAAHTTWIYRILVNACLDARRHQQRRGMPVSADDRRETPPFNSAQGRRSYGLDECHAMRAALASLAAGERQVCVMYDVMGYTHPEISRRLGIPIGTSKGRLSTARRRLRRLLTT